MKTLIGGLVAAVLGLIGIVAGFSHFLHLLYGAIPVMLLMGGGLAVYLGFDELKDSMKKESAPVATATDEIDKYKQEIDQLRKEIDTLKGEKA